MTDRREVNQESNEAIRRELWKPRPPFFVNWYLRTLAYQGYSNKLGHPACWLITTVGLKEDELRYAGPVDFFNNQLAMMCGFGSVHTLIAARDKAREHGLLYYEASVKRQAGLYFLLVPEHWPPIPGTEAMQNAVQDSVQMMHRIGKESRTDAARKGEGIAQPSLPIPLPKPIPESFTDRKSSDTPLATSKPATLFTDEIVLSYPTQGRVKQWDLTQSVVDRWAVDYPGLDVLSECRKARAWCEANATKRKTAKGMSGFLVNWLNRQADQPAARSTSFGAGRPSLAGGPGQVYDPEAAKRDPNFGKF